MRALIVAMLLFLPFTGPVVAGEGEELMEVTKEHAEYVIKLLKNKALGKEERDKKIVESVNSIFDFKRMARLSLGRKHWRTMNRGQKKEFSNLFVKRLTESYLDKMNLYTDEKVAVKEAVQLRKRIHVLTHLITDDGNLEIVYKFYKKKKGWKVYDVAIQGVSVVQTYRSQFNGILRKNTIDGMLKRLRKKGGFIIPKGKK